MSSDTEPEETEQKPVNEMAEKDWQDVAESEFVDFNENSYHERIGFVFDHPEIGLHGFTFTKKDEWKLEPVSFERGWD